MRIVPFEPAHVWGLQADLSHNLDARPWLREAPEVLEELRPFSWSMELEGRVVACGGKVPRGTGMWSWWFLAERAALEHGVELTMRVRRLLDRECGDDFHTAHAVDPVAGRWLEALGFRPVGEEFGLVLYQRSH